MKRISLCCLCIFSLVVSAGCSRIHIPFIGDKRPDEIPGQPVEDQGRVITDSFVDEGRIVDLEKLKKGGSIVIVPFTAGTGAYASDELDVVALTIVKGVIDAFGTDQTGHYGHFRVLTNENSEKADLMIQGHITRMGNTTSKVKKWLLFADKDALEVEGKLIDRNSGKTIVYFSEGEAAKTKSDDYKQLGYNIGKNIGRFLISGLE